MEIFEIVRKNTTALDCIVLLSVNFLNFLNKIVMQIFGSQAETSNCIRCLHFCLGGKTKSAGLKFSLKPPNPWAARLSAAPECTFNMVTKSLDIDANLLKSFEVI